MANDGKFEKGHLERKDNPDIKASFLFNPTEFTVEKGNQYAEVNIPGLPASLYQFVRGNSRSISMDLFFDTYEGYEDEGKKKLKDVRMYTDLITGWDSGITNSKLPGKKGLMDIDSDLHAPPVCVFVWGDFSFDCIIERVTKKFTMFRENGIPVRATLSVTLKEYKEVEIQVKEIDTKSSDLTKRWTVTRGDSLWSIASGEYGEPRDWRLIAEANQIDNPRRLTPGSELAVPKKE